jgi:Tfp pilus assembly protein PilX
VSTFTLIVVLVFMVLLVGAMVVAWKHMQVLNRYMASQPEMQRAVAALNAAVLAAQATLADYKSQIGEPAATMPQAPQPQLNSRTPRPPRENKIAQLVSTVSNQQQARS